MVGVNFVNRCPKYLAALVVSCAFLLLILAHHCHSADVATATPGDNHAHNTLRRAPRVWNAGELELNETGKNMSNFASLAYHTLAIFRFHLDSRALCNRTGGASSSALSIAIGASGHSRLVLSDSLPIARQSSQGSDDTQSSPLQLASHFPRCSPFGN